jgi:hypothetical protein
MVPKRAGLGLVIAIFLLLLVVHISQDIFAAVQKEFILDLDSPYFSYEELGFNDSNTSKEYDYGNGGGNVTYWISIPKNSTLTSASMNVTGKIIYVYNITAVPGNKGVLGVSVGNVTSSSGNETVTGSESPLPHVLVFQGYNGGLIWTYNLSAADNDIYATDVGNVTNYAGNEIAFGSQDTYVYVLNVDNDSATEAWNYSTGIDPVRAVKVADIGGDSINEVIAGADRVYVLNSSGGLSCSSSAYTVSGLSIGNVSSDPGLEIVIAASGWIRVLNSSCDTILNLNTGSGINSVAVGNISSDLYDEIAYGGIDDYVYLLNSSLDQIWSYLTQADIRSVSMGDVVGLSQGLEVISGSNDKKVYTLNSSGDLVWDYLAESYIRSVAVGNLTADSGYEVVAGAGDGKLYVFNFDYFPTNLSIDVGANGTYDWNFSGPLRTTEVVSGLGGAFQYFLDNNCSSDMCDVPVLFNSDNAGKLNVSDLNITYTYNASSIVNYTALSSTWSRTWNLQVNESIGNEVKNVSFLNNPDQDIEVYYIEIPASANNCDFNGSNYQNQTVAGVNTCNVPDFTIPDTGSLPEAFYFWESTMSSAVPVSGSESGYTYTNATDNFYSRKTITVSNNTATTFYNITGNSTVDDASVKGLLFLNVTWLGQPCNITPQSDTTCTPASPGYSNFTCNGETFYSCKNGNFFMWVQPYSNSSVNYQTGGATNLLPEASNPNVTLNLSPWGDWFNYSVFINDTDGDNVSVTLYYWLEHVGSWFNGSSVNISGEGTAWFNITSDQNWVGVNKYKFQYQDFNQSGYPFHSSINTSEYWGPLSRKHNTEVFHVKGNESSVNRTEAVELIVRINDTDNETWVGSGVACIIWVSYNNSYFDDGNFNTTNSTGHCLFQFTPDGNYSTGNQTWKGGVLDDTYYNDSNSTDFVLTINGRVNITFVEPVDGGIFYRNSSNYFEAKLVDQFGFDVNQSGFNCTFWFNYTYLNSSDTDQYGRCNITWHPQCGYSRQDYIANVTLTDPTGFYDILDNMDSRNVAMHDELNLTILEPSEYSLFHRGESQDFNSTVNDSCELCGPGDYEVNWSVKWKRRLEVTVNKTPGYEGQVFSVIINATYLESQNIDIGDWPVNYTKVLYNETEVPSRANAWTDDNKTEISWGQTYFNNFSELVFLANQSNWENLTYVVVYNRTDAQEDFGYLENSGFESGEVSPWRCFSSYCTGQYCQCEIRQEGSEVNGSYSLYLSAEDTGSANPDIQGVNLYGSRQLGQNRIKVRYKPTGEFQNDAYIRVYAGSGMCDLNTTTDVWHEDTCYNTSFSSALWVNITVHDNGSGGAEINAAHAYIDYLCLANSSGDCVNYHSGIQHPIKSLSETPIGYPDNTTWSITINESLGLRRVSANASGDHYKSEVENLYIYIYGWSNLSVGNISSTNCTYNETWICRKNASMDIFCFVQDVNTSEWVEGHNMSFWSDEGYIGSSTTNASGTALFNWLNSTDAVGNHTIICNITDDANVFYNATLDSSAEMYFNISTGNTTAKVDVKLTPATPADSLTRIFNHTYYLDINITNNGTTESMYDITVKINTTTGIYAEPVNCPPLPPSQKCDRTSVIYVSYLSTEGNKDIYVNVTWLNSDATEGNVSNSTNITVLNNTVLNVVEDEINYTMPKGGSFVAGNFTVQSFGNTDLLTIVFSESGDNSSDISQWISYIPSSIATILHDGEQSVNITLTVPDNATEGLYTAIITANATGSSCSPDSECWDSLVLNLNVTRPDWSLSQEQLNKTIGLLGVNGTIGVVQVINHKNTTWTFNVTLDSSANGSGIITVSVSEFTLNPLSTYNLEVYHNTTGDYTDGFYIMNVSVINKESALPERLNVSVSLNVINFTISILTPNQSTPVTDITPGDILNITANATISGTPVDDNITWYVRVADEICAGVQYEYNVTDQLWYINCSAPTLSGNPIYNNLNLSGFYSTEGVFLTVEEIDAVVYMDVTPPQILDIWVVAADFEGNVENATKSEILVRVDITDNVGVNASWAMLYYEDSHQTNYSMYNDSGYWTFNFSTPLNVGDFRVVVYANDSVGNENDTTSQVMGYFDLYLPIDLNGTFLNKDGTPIEAILSFYKNDTGWEIHNFTTNGSGGYNWILHRRFYDIKLEFSGHELFLSDADVNATAVNQHGVSYPENLTDPITLDYYTSENITQIGVTLPDGAENPILIVALEQNITKYNTSVLFNLDYTKALQDYYTYASGPIITESDLGVYRCANWTISQRTCIGNFQNESIIPSVDAVDDKISFLTTGASAFAVAEWQGIDQNGDNGDQTPGGNGNGGSRRTTGGVTTTPTLPFTVTTSIGSIRIHPGENKTYLFSVRNKAAGNITVSLDVQGLEDFIFPEKKLFDILYNGTETFDIEVSVPDTMGTGTYTGSILVTGAGKTQEIPVTMTVSVEAKDLVALSIDILTPNVNPGSKLRFGVELRNLALPPGFDVELIYVVKESERERIVAEVNETVFLEESIVFSKSVEIGVENPVGQYFLEVWAYFADDKSVNEVAVFNLIEPYWSTSEGRVILLILAFIGLGILGYYGWKRYQAWRLERARYIFPLNFRKIPVEREDSFWLGRIAESDKKAWFYPADLTTHLLIAGSTGAGKSVGASIFVEEALERNIPVLVFDPTAQWTGFVKALDDQNLMKYYGSFGMDAKSARPFKGMIIEITDPQELLFEIKQGFKRYLNPGEITVFTMDKLKPGQYDEAVNTIIDALFSISWEESTTLKLIVVFDEVHRLLEKYGGKGGYVSLEKAAREFRKWGIGMIMCSQVLADFKEAIAGNVLTEVQLNTKSMGDIEKASTKYGEEYAKKISRQGIGIGMIQNPKYNDGKPYFIHFRPTWHNPHKISNKEMDIYKEFANRLETIEAKIEQIKKSGKDTFDIELELKLAKDKLKSGRFRMAKIYITSLEQHLGIR